VGGGGGGLEDCLNIWYGRLVRYDALSGFCLGLFHFSFCS
jgi:hypothetical protein